MDQPAIYSETLCEKVVGVRRLAVGVCEGGDAAGACGRNDSENGSKPARTICRTNNPAGAPNFRTTDFAASVRRSRCWLY